MYAFSFQGIEIACRNTCEGLSFTGLQLEDLSFMQDYGSHDLDIVMTLAQDPEAGLSYKGVGLGENLVQCLSVPEAVAECLGLEREVLVLQTLGPAFEGIDFIYNRPQMLEVLVFLGSENGC